MVTREKNLRKFLLCLFLKRVEVNEKQVVLYNYLGVLQGEELWSKYIEIVA
jgi:hypothetical protein